jgi:hypothetical protein
VQSLLPPTPEDGKPPPKIKYFDVPDPEVTEVEKLSQQGCFRWLYNKHLKWRARHRAARMHYIFHEYAQRIKAYDEKLKRELAAEILANENAVKMEAYRSAQRKIRNSKKVSIQTANYFSKQEYAFTIKIDTDMCSTCSPL